MVVVWTDRTPGRTAAEEMAAQQRQWSFTDELPNGTPSAHRGTVSVDGMEYSTELLRHNEFCAFQVSVNELVVTVVYRGDSDPPALRTVTDLMACVARREDWTARWMARYRELHPPQPVPELEPAPGAAAHRALIEYVLANTPRDGRWATMWDRAAEHQKELCAQDRDTAVDAVAAMVNECTTLAEKLPSETGWTESIRDRVIDQCVRYTIGENVETVAVQRLWREFFAKPMPVGRDHAEQQRLNRERLQKDKRWLAGWTAWLSQS